MVLILSWFRAYDTLTRPVSEALFAVLPFLTNNSYNVLFVTPEGNTSRFLDLLYDPDGFIWLKSCTGASTHEHTYRKPEEYLKEIKKKTNTTPWTVILNACVTLCDICIIIEILTPINKNYLKSGELKHKPMQE